MPQHRRKIVLIGGAVAIVAAISGFVIGTKATEEADWHTVTAEVVGEMDHPLVSIDVDGFTYAIPDDVPYWIDPRGATHQGGWPTCLKPNPAGSATQVPRKVPIRFATVNVDADGLAWRQVVVVDCRPA
jgi:hypothetical protein